MKNEVSKSLVIPFAPVELKITIESKRELEFYISLFNSSPKGLTDIINSYKPAGYLDFRWEEARNARGDIWNNLYNIYTHLYGYAHS
jgi:hypothetical protein